MSIDIGFLTATLGSKYLTLTLWRRQRTRIEPRSKRPNDFTDRRNFGFRSHLPLPSLSLVAPSLDPAVCAFATTHIQKCLPKFFLRCSIASPLPPIKNDWRIRTTTWVYSIRWNGLVKASWTLAPRQCLRYVGWAWQWFGIVAHRFEIMTRCTEKGSQSFFLLFLFLTVMCHSQWWSHVLM
jgi:hypothetical protein